MDLYRANNANDFQPTTQDPQSGVGTNLQTPAGDLQPVPSSKDGQQNFPSIERLEVLGVDNPSSSSSRQPEVTTRDQNGLATGTVAGLILFAVFAAALLWWALKAYNEVDTFESEQEPQSDPEPDTPPVATAPVKKPPPKKTTVSKAKSKKRRKKKK